MQVLELRNVVKSYWSHVAVNNISFAVPAGKIFGLLGPNGAGKTSLIRIITTITQADSGSVEFDGEALSSKHTRYIGYMPEERGLYKKMKVGEHLLYLAQLRGLSSKEAARRLNLWFDKFEIQDWRKKKVEELSKGMQQKAQFIATVLHEPKLLILDEPFSGLDPINSRLIEEEIKALRSAGTSILFSTHRMEQVEQFCDDIVLINRGRKVLEGGVKEIRQQYKEHLFSIRYEGELPADFSNRFNIAEQSPGAIVVRLPKDAASIDLLRYCVDQQLQVTAFSEILPTLSDIFIRQVEATQYE